MRAPPVTSTRRLAAAIRFRKEIEAAAAEGVSREEMSLELTHSDISLLKRDPSVPVSDISFVGGVMRFLGVRVQEGGVTESRLVRPEV
jgi:hypothetical protein